MKAKTKGKKRQGGGNVGGWMRRRERQGCAGVSAQILNTV